MSWNYRVIEHKNLDGTSWFAIHEVYYDKDGNPEFCSEGPTSPHGEDMESITTELEYMSAALTKPTLPYSYFVNKEGRPDV